jgi:toxin secretion/phage lysis holin
MAIDYVSGIIVAGVFHKSKKTESGGLQSLVGFKGLAKKVMVLLIVAVAYRLDLTVGSSYIKDAAVIGFSANEVISIVENAGLMGIPMPEAITKAIDILSEKGEAEK